MRRLRAFDLALLGTLLPLWLACVWTSVVVGLRGGQLRLPLIVRSAGSADAYPTVWATAWPAEVPTDAVRVGDEIRRADERDLRGRSTLVATLFLMRAARASESHSPPVTFARGGQSFEVRVVPVPRRDWWSLLPFSFACVGAVTFVLLRRPDWRFARRFFVAGVWGGCGFLYFYGFEPASAAAFLFSQLVAVPLAMSLALDFAIELARRGRPRMPWQAALPWIWGIAYSGQFALVISWAPPFSLRGYFIVRAVLISVYTAALLAALVRGYRASAASERRQLRWVVYGLVVGVTPLFVSYALPAFGISPSAQRIAYFAASLALAAIPLGILVAIVWFDLLDVDRLISATASYTILGIGGFAVLFAAAPALADVATGALGVSASGAQLAIAVLLAGVVVPTQRVLRRRLDRLFFADQHDVELGVASLIEDLARAASLEEIVALTGERLLALLRPESIVLYAREHESFAPVFVRGAAAPSALPASSPLLGALATRTVPLAAEHWSHDARRAESPFECAALEALGAALVVPLRQRDSLAAFVVLGPKRSGDVYTPTDRALLGAVAARIAERLGRLGEAEFRREAEAMQSALRRYVPGAVAARVDRGEELPSGERDVSVLFVDIRGYTSLSERLGAVHIFSTINRYTECVSARVDEHGGSVVEFHGDGLLAVFGAPDPLPDKERAAVAAARELASAVRALSFEQGGAPLSVGVGIATGPAFVGNVRGHDREIWAVLGNTTNLAARLQSLTRELDAVIAIDAATHAAGGDACADFTPSGAVPIRGRSGPIEVWVLR